ncbi:MAG: tetratricopeptide repeat protein [Melioribacteraceae bacterium]
MNQKNYSIDKIKLIYEFNPESPLFARVAASIIEEGNIADALKILEKGIEKFPEYPSAYFILAIAKAYNGNETEAIELINRGTLFINSEETKDFYIKKIKKIIEERNSLKDVKKKAIWQESKVNINNSIEEQLDILAEQLSKARISYIPDNNTQTELEVPEYKGKKIVSETLAKIYESQKNFKEAISIYKELIKLHPEKSEYYKTKIKEISEIIDTGLA